MYAAVPRTGRVRRRWRGAYERFSLARSAVDNENSLPVVECSIVPIPDAKMEIPGGMPADTRFWPYEIQSVVISDRVHM